MSGACSKTAIGRWIGRRKLFVNGVLRLMLHSVRVLRSGVFDGRWYLRQHPNLAGTRLPALFHYVWRACVDDPSRNFCSDEYLHMNPDVARAGLPAILHYERYGRKTGRRVSLLEAESDPVFSPGAEAYSVVFPRGRPVHGRVAVFASYSGNGTIEPYVLHYLRGLATVCDAIVFVTDNPLFPSEREKLSGLVTCMLVGRHGEYDFGSYKRGWGWLCETGGLADATSLVFCNDSCYGPFHPFETVFEQMADVPCDFWGLTAFHMRRTGDDCTRFHLQSYFLVFSRRVFDSDVFRAFMASVRRLPEPARENVIACFEFGLTCQLEEAGFTWESYVPRTFSVEHGANPTMFGGEIMRRHGMPLMKVKTFGGMAHVEPPGMVLREARRLNPALHADLLPHYSARLAASRRQMKTTRHPHIDFAEHQASFPGKIARIKARVAVGERIRVTFLVSSAAMFPSRPLFQQMAADPLFAPRVVVVPGIRAVVDDLEATCEALQSALPTAEVLSSKGDDPVLPWRDVSVDSDIVVYNSPYAASHFFYNPRFAYGRDFLPIHVNYGYYRSVYDRHVMGMDTYAYFWKALFENEDVLAEYRHCSIIGGTNGLLTGYCKMDALAGLRRRGPVDRPCVLIAPHHSVEGGMNRVLGLSNFVRFAPLFLTLPDRYPGLDFIFRPHPALFTVLARETLWGCERTAAWQAAFSAHANTRWSDDGDALQDFVDSDAIIQDCGSFLVEYFYTGRPCCYLLKSPKDIRRKFTSFGQDCLAHCHLAYDEAAILRFIDEVVVAGHDPLAGAREQFRRERVMINYPHASAVALDFIKRELGVG